MKRLMPHTNMSPPGFAIAFLMFASGAAAADELHAIYERESAAGALVLSLERFEEVRDSEFIGAKGLIKKTDDYQKASMTWMRGFEAIQSTINAWHGSPNVLNADIASFMRNQESGFADLRGQAIELQTLAQRVRDRLIQGSSPLASSELSFERTSTLENRRLLGDKAALVSDTVRTSFQRLEAMHTGYTVQFLLNKIRLAYVREGIAFIEPTIDAAEKLILAAIQTEPIVVRVTRQAEVVHKNCLILHQYRLQTLAPLLAETCAQATQDVMAISGLGDLQLVVRDEIASVCQEAKQRVDNTVLVFSPQQLGRSMHKVELKRHQNLCLEGDSPDVRCDTLRWLRGFTPLQVGAFDDARLKALEQAWVGLDET